MSVPVTGEMDVCLWLALKLHKEWSSPDVAPLITVNMHNQVIKCFNRLEAPVKVRTLLSFLSMEPEAIQQSENEIKNLIKLAECDSDEWVRIGSGLLNRFLFTSPTNDFLHEKIKETCENLFLNAEKHESLPSRMDNIAEEYSSLESAYLSKSLLPHEGNFYNPHFTCIEEKVHTKREGNDARLTSKAAAAVAQKSRPRTAVPRPDISHQRSSSGRSTGLTSKKSMDGAWAAGASGRFKRQRNKISVIDIDEVKAIETEKAQRAEEQKKKRLSISGGAQSTDETTIVLDDKGKEVKSKSNVVSSTSEFQEHDHESEQQQDTAMDMTHYQQGEMDQHQVSSIQSLYMGQPLHPNDPTLNPTTTSTTNPLHRTNFNNPSMRYNTTDPNQQLPPYW